MSTKVLRAIAASGLLAFSAAGGFAPAAVAGGANLDGRPAPELALVDGLNGASAATTLPSLRNRVVCIKFWLTRCPICRGTLPEFQRLHDRYGRSGLACIGVVIDSAAGVGPYLREAGWTFPVGCDPKGLNASRYGVTRYPADYVVGVDGVVRSSSGFPQDVILEELRKQRLAELGPVPDALRAARDHVADGDYGAALVKAEAAAAAAGAPADVKAAAARLLEIAKQRQENRLLRAEEIGRTGSVAEARAELERICADFEGTALAARGKQRLNAFLAANRGK